MNTDKKDLGLSVFIGVYRWLKLFFGPQSARSALTGSTRTARMTAGTAATAAAARMVSAGSVSRTQSLARTWNSKFSMYRADVMPSASPATAPVATIAKTWRVTQIGRAHV